MKLSEQWLRQWVNPAVDAEQMAEQLTMAGLEVDSAEPIAPPFSGVVVGEVLTVEPHPDADRLRVTTVNAGGETPLQIVCGAPNVRAGMKAPVATVGAVLPNEFKIKKGKLRGVESLGMLCGASELGLPDQIDGLMELPADAPVGIALRDYLRLNDRVLDISITPNRGDCLSVRGIARELGVINDLPVNPPAFTLSPITSTRQLPVQVSDRGAPRYLGRVIEGVNATASTPDWMAEALERSGIRSHSLLVDITNYVLLEMGQPLHAFDADRLTGSIDVRPARDGERLTLLNDQDAPLAPDMLVIADSSGPVALAGIMGGANSSVTDATRTIFLESAFFDPLAIAGRARRLGLHTDASQRFERGVDFELPLPALERATQLIVELAGGQAGPPTTVEQTEALPQRLPIELSLEQVRDRLGFAVEPEFIVKNLTALGLHVQAIGDHAWQVTPPSWRFDISIGDDLIEEVARRYGYDQIPVTLPQQALHFEPRAQHLTLAQLRDRLVALGYQEAVSFSFSDAKLEEQLKPNSPALALANPLSSELAVMRSTLLSSLIPLVQHNLNRQQARVRLFETGLRFEPQGPAIDQLKQTPTLALIAAGGRVDEQWDESKARMDFFDFKNDIEQVLAAARINPTFERSTRPFLHSGQSAELMLGQQSMGYMGRLHPKVADDLGLGDLWVAELDQAVLQQPYVSEITELSRFASARRDIAVLVDATIAVDQLLSAIRSAAGEHLVDAWLFDHYRGNGVPEDKRSLAFAMVWQHPSRTLEDDDVRRALQAVIEALEKTYNAQLRN